MAVSLLWIGVGFLIGVLGTGFALEFANRQRNAPKTVLARTWSTADLGTEPPRVLTASTLQVPVPAGTRLLVPPGTGVPRDMLSKLEIRIHPDALGNMAVGTHKAIMFLGPPTPTTLAVSTVDPSIVDHLQRAFDRLWSEARPYVAEATPRQLHAQEGTVVEITGKVVDVLKANKQALVRVQNPGGDVVVRMPDHAAPPTGALVRAKGTVRRGPQGTVIEADLVAPAVEAAAN